MNRDGRNRRASAFAGVAILLGGCGTNSHAVADAAADGTHADVVTDTISARLRANAGASRYVLVDEAITLDGAQSVGAVRFQWDPGDGKPARAPVAASGAMVTYGTPGRYRAVLTVFDDAGHQDTATVVISVTFPGATHALPPSSSLALIPGTDGVAVVVPDADQLVLLNRQADGGCADQRAPCSDVFRVTRRIATGRQPRTVAAWKKWLAVACAGDDRVDLVPADGVGAAVHVSFPSGSGPFGVAAQDDTLYVTLQTTGGLAQVILDADGSPRVNQVADTLPDARGVSVLPDGRVIVTRWRSPDTHGELVAFDPVQRSTTIWPLAYDDQIPTDGNSGGVPSYLTQVVLSPDGRTAVVPSLIANIGYGTFRNGHALTFDCTVRAIASILDLATDAETAGRRIQFDDRGFASAAAFSPHGDYLYVAMRGNQTVERYDLLAGSGAGTLRDTGFAPDGLVVTPDGRFLLVNAALSRTLTVYDLSPAQPAATPVARVALIDAEPLSPQVLRGAQLFNDSQDPRLGSAGYIACAHCHLDGDGDRRVWDFTDRGEGLRNTISLLGRAGGDGPLHWSGNFDEVQDFENDIRRAFHGTGLMTDADFLGHQDTLGTPKVGLSADLDALAAYVTSLRTLPPSPMRQASGALTASAGRGRTIFESAEAGCTSCHSGPRLTDSAFAATGQPLLHDVGTLGAGSGQRLDGPLTGIDTPTLLGLWLSAPYLHDGSAPDLKTVLRDRNPDDRHGKTSTLNDGQLTDLVSYLLSLDGRDD